MALCSMRVQEEVMQGNKVVYMERHDMSGAIGECSVPSEARHRAKEVFKARYGRGFTILSCGLLSRTMVKLIVREGPRPQAVIQPGTVTRPAGVRKGKRIAKRPAPKKK